MFQKLRKNQALYQFLVRVAGGGGLLAEAGSLWDGANEPVYVAGLLLAGICILVGIFTRPWAGIALIGLTPLIIQRHGLDDLLFVAVFFVILVEGRGAFSIDKYIANHRSAGPYSG